MWRLAVRVIQWVSLALAVGLLVQLPDTRLAVIAGSTDRAPPTRKKARVWVRDEQGAAISQARVRVFEGRSGVYLSLFESYTGGDGSTEFESKRDASLWVLAEHPGKARASGVLSPGVEQLELRLGLGYGLSLRVRDEDGKAVEHATVLVQTRDPLPFGALTGENGSAELRALPEGPFKLQVSAPGFEVFSLESVMDQADVRLVRLAGIQVWVEGANGTAIGGAQVNVWGSRLWPARQAQTDRWGSANLEGLLPGTYELRASAGEQVSKIEAGVEVKRASWTKVTLELSPGRRVTALVTEDRESGTRPVAGANVVLAEGGFGAFLHVGRTNAEGRVTLGPIAPGPSQLNASAEGFMAKGSVEVPERTDQPVRLSLLRGATLRGEVVDERGSPIQGAEVEVVGSDPRGLPILDTPLLSALRQQHLSLILAGPKPLVSTGELGVFPGLVPPITRQLGASAKSTIARTEPTLGLTVEPWVTRSDGIFSAFPVTPGRVRALVRHPEFVDAASPEVELAPGGSVQVRIVLSTGNTLRGRVLDTRGFGVAACRVDSVSQSGGRTRGTVTATDGTFVLKALTQNLTLSVFRPGDLERPTLRRNVDPASDEELELVLPAERQTVHIRILDEREQPVPLARVNVRSVDKDAPFQVIRFSDAQGQVEINDAQGVSAELVVQARGFGRRVLNLELPFELTVELEPGVIVVGRVTTRGGRHGVMGASVTLVVDGAQSAATTDKDGLYRLVDVSPGPARLTVSHPEHASTEVSLRVQTQTRPDRPFEVEPVDLTEDGR